MSEQSEQQYHIRRTIAVLGSERLGLTLSSSGLEVWLSHSDWLHSFPLPVGRDEDWMAFKAAVESIRAEALSRARQEIAFQQLVDPIDGPSGEA